MESRTLSGKTIVQLMLNEPPPNNFTKESMVDYIRRLMLKLTGHNILGNIILETETLTEYLQSSSVGLVRAKILATLDKYFLASYLNGPVVTPPSGSPVRIKTLNDLHTKVRAYPNGYYLLMNDIDASDTGTEGSDFWNGGLGWNPIGDRSPVDATTGGFSGWFDGGGHTISNLYVDRPTEHHCGLFGFVGTGAVIKDLTVKDPEIVGFNDVGGIAGQSFGSVINCHVTGCTNSTSYDSETYDPDEHPDDVGGILGDNDGWVDSCSSTGGTIKGMFDVGGLVGDNDSVITNSYSSNTVEGCEQGDIGGLVGDNKGYKATLALGDNMRRGTIFNCYATGNVSSVDYELAGDPGGDVGGLVGDNKGGAISFSYATGNVSAYNPSLGGLAGDNKIGTDINGVIKKAIISNCYCTGTVTALGDLSPDVGNIGGFCGDNDDGQIYNSYSTSVVVDHAYRKNSGDFCADNDDGIIKGCYYTDTSVGSSEGGTYLSEADSKKQESYVGWSFRDEEDPDDAEEEGTWWIDEGNAQPILGGDYEFSTIVEVYPITIVGSQPLWGDIVPKVVPGDMLLAIQCDDGKIYTPMIFHDYLLDNDFLELDENRQLTIVDNSLGRDQLDSDILGDGLDWDGSDHIEVDLGGIDPATLDIEELCDEITVGYDNPFEWDSEVTYSKEQKVSRLDSNYKSLQDANLNKDPSTEPTWWEEIDHKVIRLESSINGNGLDWTDDRQLEVDLDEVIDISSTTYDADTAPVDDTDWNTVWTKNVTAAIGRNLDIRVFMPVKCTDEIADQKRAKFNVRICIGTSIDEGSTLVEGRYELPDHGNQVPVVFSVIKENITAADPYIRVQTKNDDNTENQVYGSIYCDSFLMIWV